MNVVLLHNSPLMLAIRGARKCYNSMDKSDSTLDDYGKKDLALIRRLIKDGHTSVIEHVYYTFDIDGVSRALLQELARHRIASYSVKSTRYTLKELKNEEFCIETEFGREINYPVVEKYCVADLDDVIMVDALADSLDYIVYLLNKGMHNDKVKYLLPESFKTSLIMTINARSLRNLLELRLSKRALWEFQELAKSIIEVLPEQHLILYEDILEKKSATECCGGCANA